MKNDVPISRRFIVRRKIVFIRTSQGVDVLLGMKLVFFLLNFTKRGRESFGNQLN